MFLTLVLVLIGFTGCGDKQKMYNPNGSDNIKERIMGKWIIGDFLPTKNVNSDEMKLLYELQGKVYSIGGNVEFTDKKAILVGNMADYQWFEANRLKLKVPGQADTIVVVKLDDKGYLHLVTNIFELVLQKPGTKPMERKGDKIDMRTDTEKKIEKQTKEFEKGYSDAKKATEQSKQEQDKMYQDYQKQSQQLIDQYNHNKQ